MLSELQLVGSLRVELREWLRSGMNGNRGKSPGEFGDRPYRSAIGRQKMAEFRAHRSSYERMLHLRARGFAPVTMNEANRLFSQHMPPPRNPIRATKV